MKGVGSSDPQGGVEGWGERRGHSCWPRPLSCLVEISSTSKLSQEVSHGPAQGVRCPGKRGWRQDCDSLRDQSLPLPTSFGREQ